MKKKNFDTLILQPGKEKPVLQRHHWIFSGAVKTFPDCENGSIVAIKDYQGHHLGYAYFNRHCSIVARMISFGQELPEKALETNLERAIKLREIFFNGKDNAYRLINGEGDNLPGLVVDRYNDVLVIQITTLGMEKLKTWLLDWLITRLKPKSILERSVGPSRRQEGLDDFEAWIYGQALFSTEIVENEAHFLVDFTHPQKTGFYLDQREMRKLVRQLAKGRKVLDCFAYTGAFAVNALIGGAAKVELVESSPYSLDMAKKNLEKNGFQPDSYRLHHEDVFVFLRQAELDVDFIILDPPAFAKKKSDLMSASRGYKDINRLAMLHLPSEGLLLTFSCSHYVDDILFQQILFKAALEAGKRIRILQRMRHSFDHPLNIFHPESHYLKGFLLYLD
ncbi:MAG: class I SAM-dependent rRNA methyltransferase [Candidatus Aminicenantes bacterium]|nr:class I SAM-dependent rRNA methyltransferase [Candidatus Aminicenantes bacterium]